MKIFRNAKCLLARDGASALEVKNVSPNLEIEIGKLSAVQEPQPKRKKYAKFGFRM